LAAPTLDEDDLNTRQLPAAFWELWALRYICLTMAAFSVAQLTSALSPALYYYSTVKGDHIQKDIG
jgi:hypothetical protein